MQCPTDNATESKKQQTPRETCANPPPTLPRKEPRLFQDLEGARKGWSDGREGPERLYKSVGAILLSMLLVGSLYLAILLGE